MTTLWIVGRVDEKTRNGLVWQFMGVFSTPEAADKRCRGVNHFMAPAELDAALPEDPIAWPGCRYPRAAPGARRRRAQ